MATSEPQRTLIVANLTASTPILLQEVQQRADERPTKFALLIPNVESKKTADWTRDTALKLLQKAAGAPVDGLVGGADPFESVPKRTSEWLRRDLPSRVEELGVPVTVITPPEEPSPLKAFTDGFSAKEPPPTAG